MHHELEVTAGGDALAQAAADVVCDRARRAVAEHGAFHLAVSGGSTPWAMFAVLARRDLPWEATVVYQVDERVAPTDDPARNLAHLREALAHVPVSVRAMRVEDPDLEAACDRYAALLPEHFDLVHLGLGPDGHTASLVPGDPVLDVDDRLVAVTAAPYQGHRRMTLTYPALARARQLLWLVTGTDKRDALRRLLDSDPSIPAGRVRADASVVVTDPSSR